MNSSLIDRLEKTLATDSDAPQISQSLPAEELDEWDEVFSRLKTSERSLPQTRAGFLTSLSIGLCAIGIGVIGVVALFQEKPLQRYVQTYTALFILAGLLLIAFTLLNKKPHR